MKAATLFLTIIFLATLIGACCHSPASVSHHTPYGFEYVGYNPGYIWPSLSDFSEMPYFIDYVEIRHHDCGHPEEE